MRRALKNLYHFSSKSQQSKEMTGKLALKRDFTPFMYNENFPFKVTVCIGDQEIVCCGAVIAQQSSVLEQKIKADNGYLMFNEFINVENCDNILYQCLEFLLGSDLDLDSANIEIVLKFGSVYKVGDLVDKCMDWIDQLYERVSFIDTTEILHLMIISNSLLNGDSDQLKQIVLSIMDQKDKIFDEGLELEHFKLLAITGDDMAMLTEQCPKQFRRIFLKWVSLSLTNKKFVIENSELFRLKSIISDKDEFSDFYQSLSETENLSPEDVKNLLSLQKSYFTEEIPEPSDRHLSASRPNTSATQETVREESERDNSTLFVGNIPGWGTKKDVANLFTQPIGRIDSIVVKKGRGRGRAGYAFINYADNKSARRALERFTQYPGKYVMGHRQLRAEIKNSDVHSYDR